MIKGKKKMRKSIGKKTQARAAGLTNFFLFCKWRTTCYLPIMVLEKNKQVTRHLLLLGF